MYMVKDKTVRITDARKRLAHQLPDPTIALAGSLMKRMIRCNKPLRRFPELTRLCSAKMTQAL